MISFHGTSGSQPHPLPPCNFWSPTSAFVLFTMAKIKQESKRCHQPRAYDRLKGPIPVAFHQSNACNKLCAQPQSCCSTGEISSLTQGHMQARTEQQTLNEIFLLLYSHLCHVYEALSLPQIISVPHPPTDNIPNPFRGKMQWLWLQSSSSISSSIAKLHTI